MSELSPNQILYEDNHLLVVDKPAGVATMGEEMGEPTVARMAANYLKRKYSKPGNVFVGIVSRLDKFVSGVLVFGTNQQGRWAFVGSDTTSVGEKTLCGLVV